MNNTILQKIFTLSYPELSLALKENSETLIKEYSKVFNEPRFRTGQTGISRRDISVWRKEGLLPYQGKEITWSSFSLIECIWLRLVSKLKKFGIVNESIIALMEKCFSQKAKDYREQNQLIIENAIIPEPQKKPLSEFINALGKISDNELEKILKENEYSLFGQFILPVCLFKMNTAFIITEDGDFAVANIGKLSNELQEVNVAAIFKQLSKQSFLLINLRELCNDFFENENLIIDNDDYWGIMNPGERKLITDIRSGRFKQITVKVEDGSITHLKTTIVDRENEDMIRKLSRLMKKGQYKEIDLITRDGVIVKYEETEILKMNK